MRILAQFIFAGCALAQSCLGGELKLSDALIRLDSLERVDGIAVGAGASTGAFYEQAKIILAAGNSEIFAKLYSSPSPIKRCMGLYCIALTGTVSASQQIKASLSDTAPIEYCPVGCTVTRSSVGAFAFNLLLATDPLGGSEPRPLIKPDEVDSLAAKALANDYFYHLRQECQEVLQDHLLSGNQRNTLLTLKQRIPNIALAALMKAIGRLNQNEQFKGILLECTHSPDADPLAKMTAWSALTRYDSPDIGPMVEASLPTLNALEPGFGTSIQQSVKIRRKHNESMAPVRSERTWMGMEAIKDKVILAYSLVDPVALADLERSFSYAIVRDHDDVRKTVATTIIALSRQAPTYARSWCIDSDLPIRLRALVRAQRMSGTYRILDEKACKAIEANL